MNTFDTIRKKLGIYVNPEYRQLTREIAKINKKLGKSYETRRKYVKTCLPKDSHIIDTLNNTIDVLYDRKHDISKKQYELSKTILNTFPLNTPCTTDHISKTLHLPRGSVYIAMYGDSGEVSLPNWEVIDMYGMQYYSRVK